MLKVTRAEGGFPVNAKVNAQVRIDGIETWKGETKIDDKGNAFIKFSLPKTMEKGDGTLNCVIDDSGVIENASKTIPILLQYIKCNVYPEGGDLVSGVENRIYIEAETPFGEPADLIGDIIDKNGQVYGTIATKHEGRGKAIFSPQFNQVYFIKVNQPSGITKLIELPKPVQNGISIISKEDVYGVEAPLYFDIQSTMKGVFFAKIFKREKELGSQKFTISREFEKITIQFTLPNQTHADGVLRLSILDESKQTFYSERLIFRKPEEITNIKINPDYKQYTPGDSAKISITTTDSKGKAVSSNLLISVVDESVLESIEKRKQRPRFRSMVFLEQEVEKLEDANIYLSNDPNANEYIDLLLGTQGWRRFVFKDLTTIDEKYERIIGTKEGKVDYPRKIEMDWDEDGEEEEEEVIHEVKKEKLNLFADLDFFDQKAKLENLPVDQKEKKDEKKMVKEEKQIHPDKNKIMLNKPNPIEMAIDEDMMMPKNKKNPMKKILKDDLEDEAMCKRPNPIQMAVNKDKRMPTVEDIMLELEDMIIDVNQMKPEEEPKCEQIRIFSHTKNPTRKPGDRKDFSETLYWGISSTNDDGKTTFSFDMSDSVTSFRVFIDSFMNGIFGESTMLIECKEPFFLEPKLPIEVTSKDIIRIPLSICNSTNDKLSVNISSETSGKEIVLKNNHINKMMIDGDQRKRVMIDAQVGNGNGSCSLTFKGSSGPFSDNVTREIKVVPLGFPVQICNSSIIEHNQPISFKFNIPKNVEKSSITTTLKFTASPAATLTSALMALLKEPSGCFEQTSSTTYPTIMAQQYFTTHKGIDPSLIQKTNDLIEKGYKKLLSYECKKGGYEWFGEGDAHEALTAYGLLEFTDMASVYPVDKRMLERTKKWLYSRKDGKGGFMRKNQSLDSFGRAADDVTNAYIIWSLTEAKFEGLEQEIEFMYQYSLKEKDSYIIGLTSASLFNIGRKKEGLELAKSLIQFQEKDGVVQRLKGTITCSGGISKNIEATSISMIAWLNYKEFSENIEKSFKWLSSSSTFGRYGNTQATVLALKSIIKYDQSKPSIEEDGFAILKIGNDNIKIPILASEKGPVMAPDFSNKLIEGDNTITISVSKGIKIPYSFGIDFFVEKPASSSECVLDLKTTLSGTNFNEGDAGEMNVEITNLSNEKLAMIVAIIGLPGGLEPRFDQLKELVKSEKIAFYETRGRSIVIYLRGMKENQNLKFKMDFIARIPGIYVSSASTVYLYYTDEFKKWVDGTKVEISPKDQDIGSNTLIEQQAGANKKVKKSYFTSGSDTSDFDVKL